MLGACAHVPHPTCLSGPLGEWVWINEIVRMCVLASVCACVRAHMHAYIR